MRVFVELSQDVDAASWGARHAAGLAADSTPYGLHHLEDHGHRVRFSHALADGPVRRVSEIAAGRLWGLQPVAALTRSWEGARRGAEVVLCMDERNGVPAALMPTRAPVVTGIAWMEDPAAMSAVHRAVAKVALDRAAGVFVECAAMFEPLVHDFRVPAEKVHFVTLGIDEQHFTPSAHAAVPDRVFSVGDDRMRDYDTLTTALRRVHEQRPGTTAEIATTLPVELPAEWTTIHRRRMDHAVKECYQRATVVALALAPTRQGSGLTVILEAMASARPLVVTDNPGLSDYVEHGVTGLLVPAQDSGAMAAAIAELLAEPDRAAAMGREGRRRVEERFTTRHMAADLDRVIRACVSR
ncbi:glycosyltransferase family 4 protein [Mobilicoccus massiliensis]|uniref:glycosyltransferase family 4 protein n=1 Tax=Mobilicoccus massiliensis TaxID=1522310 RepID=UPI00058C6655|nr:glycosyltransferase family 4 protein [Mobilicoccus massiliensis]